MPGRDRVAALKLLERLRRHEVEVTGAKLAALRSEQAALETQRTALAATAAQEASDTTVETRPYLPGYLTSVDSQQRQWAEEQDRLDQVAAEHEASLLKSFEASKTIEIVLGRAKQEIKQDADRAEAAALDEAGRTMFLAARKAAKKGR